MSVLTQAVPQAWHALVDQRMQQTVWATLAEFLAQEQAPGHTIYPAQSNWFAALQATTPQQVRVLMMLSEGLLNKQIAYELSVSEATVKAHVSAILQKLGVESRTQAVIAASKIEAGQWQLGNEGDEKVAS